MKLTGLWMALGDLTLSQKNGHLIVLYMADGGISMNNKLIFISFCMLSIAVNAETVTPLANGKTLKSSQGIMFADMNKLSLPNALKQEIQQSKYDMKAKGYIEKVNDFVPILLGIKRNSVKILREYAKVNNLLDTNLKSNISDMKLSFCFSGMNAISSKNIIGFAVSGSYKKDPKISEGWTGVGMYFTDSNIGTCVYTYNKIQGNAIMFKGDAEYKVNSKPGDSITKGTPRTGFLYNINWYSFHTANSIECANMKFDKRIMNKMFVLASKIDTEQDKIVLNKGRKMKKYQY